MNKLPLIALIIASYTSLAYAQPDTTLSPLTKNVIETAIGQTTKAPYTPAVLNVYFDSNSDIIKPKYQTMLIDMVNIMSRQSKYQLAISLIGHTDNNASNQYNLKLGKRRALAIKKMLSPRLGKSFMISNFMSQGEMDPTADNSTPLGQALNRRVEIIIERPGLGHPAFGQPVSLSATGKAALIRNDGNLILWNIDAQCPQSMLVMSADRVMTSTISPDNRLALSGDSNGRMKLWDMATSTELWTMSGHGGPVSAVAFSPFDPYAFSGSWDHQVKLWDLKNESEIATFFGHKAEVTAVALGFRGRLGLSGDTNGNLILWNLAEKKVIEQVAAHDGMINTVAFTKNMRYAISSGIGKGLLRWDLVTGEKDYIIADVSSPVSSFDLSGNNQSLIASYGQEHIIQWEIKTKKQLYNIDIKSTPILAVSYYQNDKIIMGSDAEHSVYFWDAKDGEFIKSFDTKAWTEKQLSNAINTNKSTWTDPQTNMNFSWVAPACYDMGCGPWGDSCSDSELPVHEVCLDGYWIAQNEVKQQLWTDIMGYNPSALPTSPTSSVNQVSWNDSQLFLCNLNKQTGQIYRLPAEAEWEYACRNGGKKAKFSIDVTELHDKSAENKQSKLGLVNMNDGVWEWTLDAYKNDSYDHHRRNNPIFGGNNDYYFLDGNVTRVERGGSWNKGKSFEQCSRRQNDDPLFRGFYTGLRLVKPQLKNKKPAIK